MLGPRLSDRGWYNKQLGQNFTHVQLDQVGDMTCLIALFPLLNLNLEESELGSILKMIGNRLRRFYNLFEGELFDQRLMAWVRTKYQDILQPLVHLQSIEGQPRIIVDETNNPSDSITNGFLTTDIHFKVPRSLNSYHIRLCQSGVQVFISNPYRS
jgi:hypothetical protein